MHRLLWLKLFIIIILLMFCTGCSTTPKYIEHTEYVVLIPDEITLPQPPILHFYDESQPLSSPTNFRRFQTNHFEMVDYIITLRRSLQYYEETIKLLKEKKESLGAH